MILRVPTLRMTHRCLSGDGSGDGGGATPITTTPIDDGSMTTTPMTSGESGDEFGSLPDESGDMMGDEEEDQVRQGESSH